MRKNLYILILLLVATSCNQQTITTNTPEPTPTPVKISPTPTNNQTSLLVDPISGAKSRITKKPFGIYITPKTSPVQPEKFTGYHTGTDFETTPDEQNSNVNIFAACAGKVLLKKYASGYGGVMAQGCNLNNNVVTIIYGHLRLSSILPKVGDSLTAGEQIAVLGTGYSSETDGERKHLHFGIHIGSTINILGYVQKQADLNNWLNTADYLQ